MKNKLLAFLSATIIVASNQLFAGCCAPCAPTCYSSDPCCPSNWYIAASGSVAWHNNQTFTSQDEGNAISAKREYKIGGGAAASVGYIFDICNLWDLRLEGEVLWRRNSLKNFSFNTLGVTIPDFASGHTQDIALMANLIADIPLGCDWDLYLGGGLGISFNQLTLTTPSTSLIGAGTSKSNSTLFAWQVMGGFSYDVCQNIALTAGYRLFGTEKPKSASGIKANSIPLTQSVDLGLRFRL